MRIQLKGIEKLFNSVIGRSTNSDMLCPPHERIPLPVSVSAVALGAECLSPIACKHYAVVFYIGFLQHLKESAGYLRNI